MSCRLCPFQFYLFPYLPFYFVLVEEFKLSLVLCNQATCFRFHLLLVNKGEVVVSPPRKFCRSAPNYGQSRVLILDSFFIFRYDRSQRHLWDGRQITGPDLLSCFHLSWTAGELAQRKWLHCDSCISRFLSYQTAPD